MSDDARIETQLKSISGEGTEYTLTINPERSDRHVYFDVTTKSGKNLLNGTLTLNGGDALPDFSFAPWAEGSIPKKQWVVYNVWMEMLVVARDFYAIREMTISGTTRTMVFEGRSIPFVEGKPILVSVRDPQGRLLVDVLRACDAPLLG